MGPTRSVERAVDDLDDTIKDIRAAIFGLGHETAAATGLRLAVMATVRAARDVLGAEPRVSLTGPIDTLVPADVAGAVVATVREALSNVGRHAQATRVVVELTVGSDVLLRVIDDGLGPSSARTVSGHGLSNMAERAEQLDGSFALESGDPVGTVLDWRVPLPSPT